MTIEMLQSKLTPGEPRVQPRFTPGIFDDLLLREPERCHRLALAEEVEAAAFGLSMAEVVPLMRKGLTIVEVARKDLTIEEVARLGESMEAVALALRA